MPLFELRHRNEAGRKVDGLPVWRMTDSDFNRARPIVVGSVVLVGWVKRRFSAAKGCSARCWSYLFGGADTKVAARGQAGGRRREHARQRAQARVDSRGYQVMRWSNSKAGMGGRAGSAVGSCWAPVAPTAAGRGRVRCGVAPSAHRGGRG